jgi:hypothetical protein
MPETARCTARHCRRTIARGATSALLVLFSLLEACSTEGGQTGDEGKHSGGDLPAPGGRAGSTSGGSAGSTSGGSAGSTAGAAVAEGGTGGSSGNTSGTSGSGAAGSASGGAANAECATPCRSLSCCDGKCVNPSNDIHNCGGCGIQCAGDTPFCDQGVCGAPPCLLVGAACPVGETCCVDQCCGGGELCCNVHGNILRTGCYPAEQGTCPVGCPECD